MKCFWADNEKQDSFIWTGFSKKTVYRNMARFYGSIHKRATPAQKFFLRFLHKLVVSREQEAIVKFFSKSLTRFPDIDAQS